jgi:cytochrome P450
LQEIAFQEQESIFQGSDRPVTMQDLNEMKYLERVIKETLRLYPAAPIIGRVLKQDVSIGNLQLEPSYALICSCGNLEIVTPFAVLSPVFWDIISQKT